MRKAIFGSTRTVSSSTAWLRWQRTSAWSFAEIRPLALLPPAAPLVLAVLDQRRPLLGPWQATLQVAPRAPQPLAAAVEAVRQTAAQVRWQAQAERFWRCRMLGGGSSGLTPLEPCAGPAVSRLEVWEMQVVGGSMVPAQGSPLRPSADSFRRASDTAVTIHV